MRLQNYQKVIAACKDTTSASGTQQPLEAGSFERKAEVNPFTECEK